MTTEKYEKMIRDAQGGIINTSHFNAFEREQFADYYRWVTCQQVRRTAEIV